LSRRELLLAAAAPVLAKPSGPPPNILLIQAEDVGAWMLGCHGNKEIRTPNIDLLARSGTRFLANVACAPAESIGRAALLTGRSPRKQSAQDPTLSSILSGRGFECGHVGQSAAKPEAITAEALAFLDARKADRPFFLLVSHFDAAPPYQGASADDLKAYASVSFNSIGWEPAAPNAAANRELLRDTVGSIRRCAASLAAIDRQMPPLLQRLEQRGLRDRTLIVFTSDSGSLLGRHGLWGDALASDPPNMYEEVVATPMIWNWRGGIPVESARPEVVSQYDFLPSVCELVGAPVPQDLPGRSYLRAVFNEPYPKKQPWRNLAFAEVRDTELARDARYKLTLRSQGKAPGELFDLRADPREKINQYGNPVFVTVRDRLTAALDVWRKRFA